MNKSAIAILAIVTIFMVAMGGLTLAIQDRRPVDPPTPAPVEEQQCPDDLDDRGCNAYGTGSDKVFTWSLSKAGYACQHELNNCYVTQGAEIAANKATCEAVPGCKLKYTVDFDQCELGNYKNCDPLPGTENEDVNTTYTCRIDGKYDPENYRCDRRPANEGEQTA